MYLGRMNTSLQEPQATIRAEMARRNMKLGDLSAATGMSRGKIADRFAHPDKWRLPELATVAYVLGIDIAELMTPWLKTSGVSS